MKRKMSLMLVCGLLVGVSLAGEITANFVLKVTKGGVTYINEAVNQSLILTNGTPNVSRYTVIALTNGAGTALDLGSVATNGVCWLQNTDTNNYCDVGVQVTNGFFALIRLKAGEAWPIRVTPGVTPYTRANGASVVLKQPIVDD